MGPEILAALTATIGFAAGDICTAILTRRVSAKASMTLLVLLKLLVYVPLIVLWLPEFGHVDGQSLAWSVALGLLFTLAYLGLTMGFEMGKNPALVGVVAGCFPASASFVAIVFLGQRPSALTLALLVVVLAAVMLIGWPTDQRSFKLDKGVALACVPLICWGVFGALLNVPVNRIHTEHGWFVVQVIVSIVMVVAAGLLYNRAIPGLLRDTSRHKAWKFALGAGIIAGVAEGLQAFSLGSGQQIVLVEALLGSYPAAYFLIARKIFKEKLHLRQWIGIGMAVVAVVWLSTSS